MPTDELTLTADQALRLAIATLLVAARTVRYGDRIPNADLVHEGLARDTVAQADALIKAAKS